MKTLSRNDVDGIIPVPKCNTSVFSLQVISDGNPTGCRNVREIPVLSLREACTQQEVTVNGG